jgi:hypothetical protein
MWYVYLPLGFKGLKGHRATLLESGQNKYEIKNKRKCGMEVCKM